MVSAIAFAGANIRFDQLNLNAGTLRPNSRAKIIFKFKNTGDSALEINKVNAACGCTVPKVSKRVFSPGESGELILWFYTAGYYGTVRKTATILTNSELNPAVTVSFNAVVKAELLPDETKIEFRDVVPGKKLEQIVTIRNQMNHPAKLGKGSVLFGREHVSETGFGWKLKTKEDGSLALTFSVNLKKALTIRRPIRLKVGFPTNSKLDPKLIFYVTIRPMPPMVVTPTSFFLPNLSPGAKRVASIHVDSNGGQRLAVERVKISSVPFTYEIETQSETSVVIWLNVNETAQSGRVQGSLQLFTTVGGLAQMRIIPVKGQIQ